MRLLDAHIHLRLQSQLDTPTLTSLSNPSYSQHAVDVYLKSIQSNSIPTGDHPGFIFVGGPEFSFDPLDWTRFVTGFEYDCPSIGSLRCWAYKSDAVGVNNETHSNVEEFFHNKAERSYNLS